MSPDSTADFRERRERPSEESECVGRKWWLVWIIKRERNIKTELLRLIMVIMLSNKDNLRLFM